jgi:hypothetical protein
MMQIFKGLIYFKLEGMIAGWIKRFQIPDFRYAFP